MHLLVRIGAIALAVTLGLGAFGKLPRFAATATPAAPAAAPSAAK